MTYKKRKKERKKEKTSLRTVSPSFTILGGPYLLCNTTFLPLGPNVTPSSSATKFTPACTTIKNSLTHSLKSFLVKINKQTEFDKTKTALE
jgi:hypothetical protein